MFHFFFCELEDAQPQTPTETDLNQDGCEWVDFKQIAALNLRPLVIQENLRCILNDPDAAGQYWGYTLLE